MATRRQQVVVMADMLVAGPLDQMIDTTQIEYDFRAFMREKYGNCAPTCHVRFGQFTQFTDESEDDDV